MLLITGYSIILISMLRQLRRFLWPSVCADSFSLQNFQWCSLSMISTWSHRGRWSPCSLHMWPDTPDLSTSPRVTAFWCSLSLTLRGRPVPPLYFLLQLHEKAYAQSLVMFSFMVGVLLGRDICEVPSSFWRLSWCYMDRRSFVCSLITPSHKTGRLFSECFSSLLSAYPSFCVCVCGGAAMYSGYLLRCRVLLIQTNSLSNVSRSPLMTFARCCKQRTIAFFTLYGWWELKLRYCPVNVGFPTTWRRLERTTAETSW